MRDIWDRLEKWLDANAPQVAETLQPGATEEQLGELETLLGTVLPSDLRESLLIHNGQIDDSDVGFMNGQEFLSVDRIRSEWSVWKELLDNGEFSDSESDPGKGIRSDWWNQFWVPLTYDGAGNHYCIDLAPGPGGKVGQMITMWHDDAERSLLAPSYRLWLESYASALEQGRVVFSEDYNGLVDADDL